MDLVLHLRLRDYNVVADTAATRLRTWFNAFRVLLASLVLPPAYYHRASPATYLPTCAVLCLVFRLYLPHLCRITTTPATVDHAHQRDAATTTRIAAYLACAPSPTLLPYALLPPSHLPGTLAYLPRTAVAACACLSLPLHNAHTLAPWFTASRAVRSFGIQWLACLRSANNDSGLNILLTPFAAVYYGWLSL